MPRETMTPRTPISSALIAARMREVLEDRLDPREFRLSEVGRCPRMRIAKVLGIPGEDPTETDAAYFERGRIVERWIVEQFREQYPRRCRTQTEVRTPTGEVGHIDLTFPAERLIVEVKSVSVGARDLPRPEHVRQCQAYLHFWRDAAGNHKADTCELVYVRWGAGLETESYTICRDSNVGRDIEAELRELHSYRDRGTLPPIPAGHKPESYPCRWRNRAGEVHCSHYALCWSGAAAVPPLDAPEVAEEAGRLYELTEKLRSVRHTAEDLEGAIEVLRSRLGRVLSEHGRDALEAGGILVRRTPVAGRDYYDIPAALKAGAVSEAALAPYRKVNAGYDRWTVKRVEQKVAASADERAA